MEPNGKLAVVTGASRGIGRALALELARSGCGLLLTAYEAGELTALLDELRSFPVSASALPADLTEPGGRKTFLGWVKGHDRPPDILVNNAGMGGPFRRFEALDLAAVEKITTLNVSAFVHITHELIPLLKTRPQARIVNISSGIARLPYPGLAVYGATKAFVSSFSDSLACELAGSPVDVMCFHPGFTMSSFVETSGMDMSRIPKILLHTPGDIAAKIVQALRDDRRWAYSDLATMLGAGLGQLMPHRMRTAIFKGLFWRLPDA